MTVQHWHYSVAFLIACLVFALIGCDRQQSPESAPSTQATEALEKDAVAKMREAIDARDWELAETYSKQALIENPSDPDIMTLAASVAAFRDHKREAAMMLVDAAKLADFEPPARVDSAIRALIDVGEVYPAIELLEASLQQHPDRNDERLTLVGFWNEVQRTDRLSAHLQKLIQSRAFSLHLLLSTTDTSGRRMSLETSKKLLERNPNDLRCRLADATVFLTRRDATSAAEVLEAIMQRHPDFAPAHAMYGQALTATLRWAEIPRWLEQSVPGSSDYADHWLTLGDFALEQDLPSQAARAYWEATRRDPNRSDAWDRLRLAVGRLLESDSPFRDQLSADQLRTITDHANRLLAVRETFNDFAAGTRKSQTAAVRVAEALADAGRLWEAEAWAALATTLSEEPSVRLESVRVEVLNQLRRNRGWVSKETPAMGIDFSFLPLPKVSGWDGTKRRLIVPTVPTHDHIRMTEQTARWGLQGVGDGNDPSDPRLAALIRSTGVGGGTLDYDLDGWPDLLVMNAGGSMLETDSLPNQMMRNLGESFVSVGELAGIDDTHYGQGVAVGDFNEDGFPDLFFANLGKNLLLRNNGDGTFTDCSDRLVGDIPKTWSTSGAFVDIDGDAITDLVVTQYCRPVPKLSEPCPDEAGRLGPCHPLAFPADTDQFFAGTKDGTLVDATARWVGEPLPGRGLGILSGALDGRQIGIFVANDMSRNSYYTAADGDRSQLVDSASARGVAVDGRSLAQASMGIAASDFDQDGDLDLYVTGFGREYNILYEQVATGIWKDETAKLNLIEPTLSVVGFGTQAIDLDNDGIDEIVVTNGDIGKFPDEKERPFEQPLQVFRRAGDGIFALLEDDAWGDYFRNGHVGRALWTTDVNRDGKNDVVVTHTREQIGLLVNQTSDENHRIGLKLVGTACSRDAVGAVIRFQVDGKPRTLWILSGDGYFCSNEKTLIAGLGEVSDVTDLTVTWQDGSVDAIGRLQADKQYLIVQGSGTAYTLDEYQFQNH